ncbi:MAG: tyrosine-type recombinase/integrase [Pirellulaceae bacterium]|nr:tyrosine-type recombinase/integrase [Pirellulaceae bacterium]
MNDSKSRLDGRHTELPSSSPNDLPGLVNQAGGSARFAWEEFIYGRIRNRSTRKNYLYACTKFLNHCERKQISLENVMPRDVADYIDSMPVSAATKKLHLAALRLFFDILVNRHGILLNPAASVRGPKLQVIEGKTPEIGVPQARKLLQSIDITTIVGLRDRAVISVLIYTAVRGGAVAGLKRSDFYNTGNQYCLRFEEKGGKSREIPCRHDLQIVLQEYLSVVGDCGKSEPLFRTVRGKTNLLTELPMSRGDISRLVKRRCRKAGLSFRISPHSFRVTTITDLLSQGSPLEDVQYLAGHADPRTTRLYDRRKRQVTRNIVERISI